MNDFIRQLGYERKNSLPSFKIICSVCFIVILALVRGVSHIGEIGIVLGISMPVLAIVFCADLYEMEYSGKRWEVFRLYSLKKRMSVVWKRLGIQIVYLWVVSVAGYACFFWQNVTYTEEISNCTFFVQSMAATAVSIAFFGVFSVTVATAGKNSWYGIGASLVIWLLLNSNKGRAVLGNLNLFAFTFRDVNAVNEMGWIYGKGVAIFLVIGMLVILPWIIKKR